MERTDIEQWRGKEVARLLALVETERRYYQEMVASLPVALAVLSSDRSIISANRAFRSYFGLRPEEFRRRQVEHILPSTTLLESIRAAHISNLPQEVLPPLDLGVVFDAFRRESVNHAHDAPALVALCKHEFAWVRRRTDNAADFRHHLQRVQDVERKEPVAQEDNEAVACSDGSGILLRQFNHGGICARPTDEALPGSLAERQSEFDAGDGSYQSFVDVLVKQPTRE